MKKMTYSELCELFSFDPIAARRERAAEMARRAEQSARDKAKYQARKKAA